MQDALIIEMIIKQRMEEREREAARQRLADQVIEVKPRRPVRAQIANGLRVLAVRVEGAARLSTADA
jgi:hypothetical protein